MHGVRTDLTEAQVTQLSLSMQGSGENIQEPYYIWVEEKAAYKNVRLLAWNERPIDVVESLALLRERPNIFRILGTFSFELASQLSEYKLAALVIAGSTRPGPLGYTMLDENVKILTSADYHNVNDPNLLNIFVLKGKI